MMMFDPGIRQQILTRPKAEMCFRPWWDTIEDTVLVSMIGLGNDGCSALEIKLLLLNSLVSSNLTP